MESYADDAAGLLSPSWSRFERRLTVSSAVAARKLPRQWLLQDTGLGEATRQAGEQGCCGVEVRGFEPLASSVRERIGVAA